MGLEYFCAGMNACLETTLSSDEITKNINKFFMKLLIRGLNLDELKDKVVQLVFSNKVLDLEAWEKLLKETILDSEAVQTSNKVVKMALSQAKEEYDDPTLPFISLYLLANSKKDIFIEAFKYVNLVKNGVDTVKDVKDMVETVKKSENKILTGIVAGIQTVVKGAQVVQQAMDPNQIKKDDLKSLMSYYINFITFLPVDIIDEFGEFGPVVSNITKILNTSFDKNFRDDFVENILFEKYKDGETINVKDFFTDNYSLLKDDRGIRVRMVQSYIKTLNPLDALLKPINQQLQAAQNYLQEQQKNLADNREQQNLNINQQGEQKEEEVKDQ